MQRYSSNCCLSSGSNVSAHKGALHHPPAPVVITRSIYHRQAVALPSKGLSAACFASKPGISSPSNSNVRTQTTAAAFAAAALLVLPVGGSCAAADPSTTSPRLEMAGGPAVKYNITAQYSQLSPVPAPELIPLLVPATPFQTPGKVTPPAAGGARQSFDAQSSNSGCKPSVNFQLQEQQQQQRSPTAGPLDPPTPPNSPLTPPPPHAPLPTPQQPHFPLLPSPPPPALPPQLLPPCNDPPPQKLLPRAQPGGMQQEDVRPVFQDLIGGVSSSRAATDPVVEDSPVSLLRLFKAEQLLQEQWQQALLFNAFNQGSTASAAVQELPALPISADLPAPYQNTAEPAQDSWKAAPMGVADLFLPPTHVTWSLDAGDRTHPVVVLAAYSVPQQGLFAGASFAAHPSSEPVENGHATTAAAELQDIKLTSSPQQLQLAMAGSRQADNFPTQVVDAAPTPANHPEDASAITADSSAKVSNGSKSGPGGLAATTVTATAVDRSSSAGQGSTGTPILPLQGGGSGSSGSSGKGIIRGIAESQQSPLQNLQSAKAADSIKEGIRGAQEQIAARSKQLEYQSPGYEQLLDSSKRLLVALIAIVQFLIKLALAVGVVLVRGLVQLIQWVMTLSR